MCAKCLDVLAGRMRGASSAGELGARGWHYNVQIYRTFWMKHLTARKMVKMLPESISRRAGAAGGRAWRPLA